MQYHALDSKSGRCKNCGLVYDSHSECGLVSIPFGKLPTISEVLANPPKLFPEIKTKDDMFHKMWNSQKEFMKLLVEKRGYPSFPADLTTKAGQKHVKDLINECMNELWEASYLLKNSKKHRKTEIIELDKKSYIEELVDVQKYLLGVLIESGVSIDEFFASFNDKTEINKERIKNDY